MAMMPMTTRISMRVKPFIALLVTVDIMVV
jgi:hypothetical protein